MLELYISKIFPLFIYPLGFTLTLCVLALLLRTFYKSHRLAWWLIGIGAFQLWLSSTPLVSNYIFVGLESYYPAQDVVDYPTVQAIVVIGGGLESIKSPRRTFDVGAAGDRIIHTARLYHAGKAPLILVSGGTLPWQKISPETDGMLAFLQELGVSAEFVMSEPDSINTYENALFSKKLLDRKGIDKILLVTSAFHMRRSAAVFRKVGFEVIPVPTDFRVVENSLSLFDYLPDARYLEQTTIAIKEYIGLAYYTLRQRI